MQVPRFATFARALAIVAALGGCNALPRSGPTLGDIKRSQDDPGLGMHIVRVTPAVAAASRSPETLGFGAGFIGAGAVSPDTIRPGDTVAVRVWENVDTGLLAGVGQRVTTLEAIPVDQSGEIFVPYAGNLQASGRTPDELRAAITESLEAQTPDPQVEVRRIAGDGSTVSVMGGVQNPGVYPIEAPTRRLSAMLAAAGGVAVVPEIAQVKMERGGRTGRIWLQDLYDNSALDIALRPDDRIIVEEDRRSFTALGATEGQARVNFTKRDMSAVEAIAAAGGLDGRTADPTGVFIFRDEPAEIANRVLGRADLVGPQRMAYLLDLRDASGLFSARDFVIRDEDTLYITEAPLASWTRVLAVATAAVALTRTAEVIAQ
jgi:polysaccharide export outer membrane protein